jgi:hypothetical protein
MIKNFTLSILAATLSFSSFAQTCTPDGSFSGEAPGIYPVTPLEPSCNLIAAKTIVSLTDSIFEVDFIGPVFAYIDAMRVLEVTGLPAGLTFETDVMASADLNSPFGIWFNSGAIPNQVAAIGCAFAYGTGGEWDALINGGPNSDGIYPIEFVVDARIAQTSPDLSAFLLLPNGTWISDPDFISYTGGPFTILQEVIVLPGYDIISAVITGETNPMPFASETYSVEANPDITYFWHTDGGTITGGQGTNEVTIEWGGGTGLLLVEMTDGECYGYADIDVTIINVGVANADLSNLKVWPNPSSGMFEIVGLDEASMIQVLDLSGRTIFEDRINVGSKVILDLSDDQPGVYLLRITADSGTTTKRIIKN